MLLRSFALMFIAWVFFILGCGGTPANQANTNSNRAIILDPANMPPGLSASPLQMNANIPGIPVDPRPVGSDPTPGIAPREQRKKDSSRDGRSTPGIPDPETLRKAREQPSNNRP